MKKLGRLVLLIILSVMILPGPVLASGDNPVFLPVVYRAAVMQAPVLKWAYAGCYASWCETGWYSSPAVADLDGDNQPEVVASAYSIWAIEGGSGVVEWKVASGHDRSQPGASNVGRTWSGIAIADINQDSQVEIVTAHSDGWLSAYTRAGYFLPGFPVKVTDAELRGLSVADLETGGQMELIVTRAGEGQTNTWVYHNNGSLRSGFPQIVDPTAGYAWGVYNANAAVGDIDGNSSSELIVPSDVHYIGAYQNNGAARAANSLYGSKVWGQVGVWESYATELKGWGECDGIRAESYRTNFADGAAVIADVNGDGTREIVATGNVYDCTGGGYVSRYRGVYIFNADRSRFNSGGYDWRSVPVDTGAPLQEDWQVIETAVPNPAVADLDGDGRKEIIFPSYDGRVHAFWLDKTEKGAFPFAITKPGEGFIRFASEVVVADLFHDGAPEILFTSWTEKPTGGETRIGKLHILNNRGEPLFEISLPQPRGGGYNGALPAPTLANIDADADLEIVINTIYSGVVAYDLPGTANAVILWGTGRGNQQRTGVAP